MNQTNNIKLIAFDIDDTLMGKNLRISAANLAAIERAKAAGTKIIIATGRTMLAARPILETLRTGLPSVHFGGAVILDADFTTVLQARYIARETVRAALLAAGELGLVAQVYSGDLVIAPYDNEFTRIYCERLHLPHSIRADLAENPPADSPKVLAFAPPECCVGAVAALTALLPSSVQVLQSLPGFLEINDRLSTKGNALRWICERMGIVRENVAAAGDNSLDLDMIEWAGLGCAVGNATPAVKAAADLILPPCDEDGAAWLVERVLAER
ncbi:MAG: Cof-type HAD-IIB family hydrolase [Clostridiales bacterium]|nr:Cof-type HAD-IIB family hydrolase [Clostridiales bacterium]